MDSRIVVVVLAAALFGPVMVSAQTGCDNATMIAKMNGYVTTFNTTFSSIMTNVSIPQADKMMRILNAVCNDTTIRPKVDDVETQAKLCPALIANSNLKSLTLGPLRFTDLFLKFTSVVNFCGCVHPMLSTMTVADMKSMLVNSSSALQYPLLDVSMLCKDHMQIKKHVMAISDNLPTCPTVLQFSNGFLTLNNVKLMKDFETQVCPSFNATKFRCAVETSASASFKNCIRDQSNATTPCKKRACVISSVSASCAAGSEPYMWSVNMVTDATFELMDTMCDTDDATTTTVSTLTIVVALISSFLIL